MNHHIEVDLDDQEYDLLLLILGAGRGFAHANGLASVEIVVALTNKLFAQSPGFVPYMVKDGHIVRSTTQ